MSLVKQLLCTAAVIALTAGASAAPSFDCSKATDPVDKLVCSDATLGDADKAMSEQYAKLIAAAGPQKSNVILLQRAWLKHRSDACKLEAADALACLRDLYKHQRIELTGGVVRAEDKSHDALSEWIRENAFTFMASEPRTAEKILRTDSSPQAKAGLALVLAIGGNKAEVGKLVADIAANGENKELLEYSKHYDGSLASLTPYLQAAGEVQIPCALIERHPELINAIHPWFGSNRDNFLPTAICPVRAYPEPASVARLEKAISAYDGDAFDRCTGSLRNMYFRQDYVSSLLRRVIPRWQVEQTLAQKPVQDWTKLDITPLQRWSYLGPWNRAEYLKIREQFIATRKDLADFYQQRFAMTPDEALQAAHIALWADYYWTRSATVEPLAVTIMEKDAKPSLDEMLAAHTSTDTKPEPVLSLAIARPETIAPLLAAGANVNAANPFGKTPLMTAAQFNNLEAVRAFLAAGAKVNAISLAPETIEDNSPRKPDDNSGGCEQYAISNGSRTALMYAAANASLEIIATLVKAGADVAKRDSQGKSALDYLSGRGPVPKNPVLSAADFDKAKRLLTP